MILKRAVKHSNQQSEICLMNEKGEKKGENGNDYPSWKLNTKINFERMEQTKCLQLLASDDNSGQKQSTRGKNVRGRNVRGRGNANNKNVK